MKARASNLVIGTTTLAVIAAAFAGLLGFQKIHGLAQRSQLRIVFEGSASGLRKGGNVNFDGVQIGEIRSLKLDNPRKVVALTLVDSSAPIRKDTVVGLEFQGLTGVAAISLDYRESWRHDDHGNWFRYAARVRRAHGFSDGLWAYDVFLARGR